MSEPTGSGESSAVRPTHVQFSFRPTPTEVKRRSRCLRGDHRPKFAFASQVSAEEARAAMATRVEGGGFLEAYPCSECGYWHLGNARPPEGRTAGMRKSHVPFERRVVHREDWLLSEVGERAAVQMLAESADQQRFRFAAVVQRLRSAARVRRNRPSLSGAKEGQG